MANTKYILDRERRIDFDVTLTSAFHKLQDIKHLSRSKKRDLGSVANLLAYYINDKPERL